MEAGRRNAAEEDVERKGEDKCTRGSDTPKQHQHQQQQQPHQQQQQLGTGVVPTDCALGPWRLPCLQPCANLLPFTLALSFSGFASSLINPLFVSQVTSIERQFHMSSTQTGGLMAANDVGFLLLVLLVAHFCKKSHVPRILALSSVMYSLSAFGIASMNFLYPQSLKGLSSNPNQTGSRQDRYLCLGPAKDLPNDSRSCGAGEEGEDGEGEGGSLHVVVLMGMFFALQGVAKATRSPLGVTYIDDNVPHHSKTGFYVGITLTVVLFGPPLGFALGGVINGIPVDLSDTVITPRDPRWISAWWLGFLPAGFLSLLLALPLFCFPRRMKTSHSQEDPQDHDPQERENVRKEGENHQQPPSSDASHEDQQEGPSPLQNDAHVPGSHRQGLESVCKGGDSQCHTEDGHSSQHKVHDSIQQRQGLSTGQDWQPHLTDRQDLASERDGQGGNERVEGSSGRDPEKDVDIKHLPETKETNHTELAQERSTSSHTKVPQEHEENGHAEEILGEAKDTRAHSQGTEAEDTPGHSQGTEAKDTTGHSQGTEAKDTTGHSQGTDAKDTTGYSQGTKSQGEEGVKSGSGLQKQTFSDVLKELPVSLCRLLRAPVYVLMVLAMAVKVFALVGFTSFLIKYLYYQFDLEPRLGSFIFGATSLVFSGLGTFSGGVLTSRIFKTRRQSLTYVLVVHTISLVLISITLAFGCDPRAMVGLEGSDLITNGDPVTQCQCDVSQYLPVCDGKLTYLSPCQAGCTQAVNATHFTDCNLSAMKTVSAGVCSPGCDYLVPFIVLHAVSGALVSSSITPLYISIIRSAPQQDKTLALGMLSFIMSLIGFIPGPIAFGAIVDTTCLLWTGRGACGGAQGACALYNVTKLRLRYVGLEVAGSVVSLGLTGLGFVVFCWQLRTGRAQDDKLAQDMEIGAGGEATAEGESGGSKIIEMTKF